MARQRTRIPPDVQHVRIGRLGHNGLDLGPQGQKTAAPIPALQYARRRARVLGGRRAPRGRRELYVG